MKTTITAEQLNELIIAAKANIKNIEAEGKNAFREIRSLDSLRAAKRIVVKELTELLDDHNASTSWKYATIMVVNNGGLHEALMFLPEQIHSLNFIRVREDRSVALSRWGAMTAMKPCPTPEAFLEASGRKDVTLIGTIEM